MASTRSSVLASIRGFTRASIRTTTRSRIALAVLALVALAAVPAAYAQEPVPYAPVLYTPEQLDHVVAPVALYPDVVLDSLLPATATPDEIADAAARLPAGSAPATLPANAPWGAAVQGLYQFPDVLRWLAENPQWVDQMGYAMTTQPEAVLDAIQRYRALAHRAGALESTEHHRVVVRDQYIVIEPISPEIVYVPVYDPWVLFEPEYVYVPSRPFYRSWWGFPFAGYGPWTWFELRWGASRGVYHHARPYWWNRWDRASYAWGPDRPRRWDARSYDRDRRDVRRRAPSQVVRPRSQVETRSRTEARTPTSTAPAATPQRNVVQPPRAPRDLRQRFGDRARDRQGDARTRATPAPSLFGSRANPTPVAPRATAPPEATSRATAPPEATSRATTPSTPPRVRERPAAVRPERSRARLFERSTIESWGRRGRQSLEESRSRARVDTPALKVEPTPRASRAQTPQEERSRDAGNRDDDRRRDRRGDGD